MFLIHGRIAFVLALAERAVESTPHDWPGRPLAEEAVRLGWLVQGQSTPDPDALYDCLENDQDRGMLNYEWEATGVDESKWLCLTYAISYVCRCAYDLSGARAIPSPILEVTDEVLDNTAQYAIAAGAATRDSVQRLKLHLFDLARDSIRDERGPCVDRVALQGLFR